MTKRNIIILIACTGLLIIVVVTTMQEKPEIENIYLSTDRDYDFEKSAPDDDYSFGSHDQDIYLIIEVKRLDPEDEIKVEWLKAEEDSYDVIQQNIINPEEKGSGKIIISLIKHDDIYFAGNYIVKTYLNGDKKITEEFYVQNRT